MILRLIALLLITVIGFLLLNVLVPGDDTTESAAREEYLEEGPRTTGAVNIVSAIYLGYRAYDTVGEAIVLLLAVTGIVFFAGREHV